MVLGMVGNVTIGFALISGVAMGAALIGEAAIFAVLIGSAPIRSVAMRSVLNGDVRMGVTLRFRLALCTILARPAARR
jgi:hypothetical protein